MRSSRALAGTLALLCSSGLAAQPSPDARALADRATARIRALREEADRLASASRTVLTELRQLELARAIERETVARAEAQLADVTAARDAAAAQVATLRDARVAGSPGVAERLVEIYKRGRGGDLKQLLSVSDARALGRMRRGVAAVAELDRVRLDAQRRTLAAEQAALADLTKQQDALAAAATAAVQARADLDAAIDARNRRVAAIEHERSLSAQFVAELQAAQLALQEQVPAASGAGAPRLPIRPFRGALDWPVTGRVVSSFGRAPVGRFGTTVLRNGIEIAAAEGQPARAVHEGVVAYAAPFAGFGTLVIVDHGGNAFTLYGHLLEARVAPGTPVARGVVVGTVGVAPTGTPALYFELRIDGRPVDPLQWLGRSR